VRTTLTVYAGLVEANRAGLRGDLETAFGAARSSGPHGESGELARGLTLIGGNTG
jgi:hypothetical protein